MQLKIWSAETGQCAATLLGHTAGIVVLTGGSDMQLKIWSAETVRCAATLLGHTAGKMNHITRTCFRVSD